MSGGYSYANLLPPFFPLQYKAIFWYARRYYCYITSQAMKVILKKSAAPLPAKHILDR